MESPDRVFGITVKATAMGSIPSYREVGNADIISRY